MNTLTFYKKLGEMVRGKLENLELILFENDQNDINAMRLQGVLFAYANDIAFDTWSDEYDVMEEMLMDKADGLIREYIDSLGYECTVVKDAYYAVPKTPYANESVIEFMFKHNMMIDKFIAYNGHAFPVTFDSMIIYSQDEQVLNNFLLRTIGKDIKTMNEEAILLDLSTLVDEELATLKSWNERVIVANDEVRSNLSDYMYKQFAKLFQSVEDKQFFHKINVQIEDAIFSIGSNFEQIDYRWLSLISDGDVYNVYRDYAEDYGYTALDDMFDIIYRQFESEWEEIVETYIESLDYEYAIGFDESTNDRPYYVLANTPLTKESLIDFVVDGQSLKKEFVLANKAIFPTIDAYDSAVNDKITDLETMDAFLTKAIGKNTNDVSRDIALTTLAKQLEKEKEQAISHIREIENANAEVYEGVMKAFKKRINTLYENYEGKKDV